MKALIFSFALFCTAVITLAATDGEVSIYGKLKSQNNDAVVLETEDAIVTMPKKFMTRNAKVGQRIAIVIPKDGFKDLHSQPLTKVK